MAKYCKKGVPPSDGDKFKDEEDKFKSIFLKNLVLRFFRVS